jgi:hypothetical protein
MMLVTDNMLFFELCKLTRQVCETVDACEAITHISIMCSVGEGLYSSIDV